ncbi:pseudouridine synthase [Kytococcus sedentarius]|uniref:pseudouridine synthase n=1 Tax=Kytococcus sedentarius TaxID=1276 RepID=UPI00194F55ED|nr:pseudouridine synthase [Kytococcus sedentarius]QRO86435.1 rRNA pseudouridine synthase [Kytococcus sedentarius]
MTRRDNGPGRPNGQGKRGTGGFGPVRKRRSRPGGNRPDHDVHTSQGERLQKVLAAAGLGSRRACEQMIADGRVEVDGVPVTELGVRIDPSRQKVAVDGLPVQLDDSKVYLVFNKPVGVISTMEDEEGRLSVGDYTYTRKERLFHVGRLDQDTSGLLLLTNDGELAHRLQHPSYSVPKTYVAKVPGPVKKGLGNILREGVELEDGVVTVDDFSVVASQPGWAMVQLVIHEGRKHVVRRLLEEVGYPVEELVRTQVGEIRMGDLRPGNLRAVTPDELARTMKLVGL